MIHWFLFVSILTLMYLCISTIGKMSGGEAQSVLESVKNLFTPFLLVLVLISNILFAIGIYYGFIVTSNALTISIVIGVVTSFVYSVVMFGVSVTATKLVGLGLVLIGVYLLR